MNDWIIQDRDSQRTLAAIVPFLPCADPQRFNDLQSTAYQTAIIKNDEHFLSQTKKVKTVAGDSALVVHGPGDGNCLPVALVRGLISGGKPLSPNMEQQAMEAVRAITSSAILEHKWPHRDVASPQTIAQCAEETARNGGWCGEVAMAAFAALSGTCLKLYRYVNNEQKSNTIEPLMNWNINEGDGDDRRPVIHLLQTRLPLPGQPEHCSHWEILILLPPEPAAVGIEYGPIDVENKNSSIECYEFIVNRNVDPHLKIARWFKYEFKGRGKKPAFERVVCQIHRKINFKRGQPSSYGPPQISVIANDGSANMLTKAMNDVQCLAKVQSGELELKEVKYHYDKAIAPIPAVVIPIGPAGAARKRKRNHPVSTVTAPHVPTQAKPKAKRQANGTPKKNAKPKTNSQSRARSSSSSSDSNRSSSESDVTPVKARNSATKVISKSTSAPVVQLQRQLATRPAHRSTPSKVVPAIVAQSTSSSSSTTVLPNADSNVNHNAIIQLKLDNDILSARLQSLQTAVANMANRQWFPVPMADAESKAVHVAQAVMGHDLTSQAMTSNRTAGALHTHTVFTLT